MAKRKYILGDDGELQEIVDTRKSKPPHGTGLSVVKVSFIVFLAGFLLLLGVAAGIVGSQYLTTPAVRELVHVVTATPVHTRDMIIVTATPLATTLTVTNAIRPTTEPKGSSTITLNSPLFVVGTKNGAILTNTGSTFTPLSIQGYDVAASPDGTSLAYRREDERLVVYANSKELTLNSFADHKLPLWGPKGKTLTYLANGIDGQGMVS
jgi:hypothetical protein